MLTLTADNWLYVHACVVRRAGPADLLQNPSKRPAPRPSARGVLSCARAAVAGPAAARGLAMLCARVPDPMSDPILAYACCVQRAARGGACTRPLRPPRAYVRRPPGTIWPDAIEHSSCMGSMTVCVRALSDIFGHQGTYRRFTNRCESI